MESLLGVVETIREESLVGGAKAWMPLLLRKDARTAIVENFIVFSIPKYYFL